MLDIYGAVYLKPTVNIIWVDRSVEQYIKLFKPIEYIKRSMLYAFSRSNAVLARSRSRVSFCKLTRRQETPYSFLHYINYTTKQFLMYNSCQ